MPERARASLLGLAAATLLVLAGVDGAVRAQSQPGQACDEEAPQTAQIRCYFDAAEAAGDPAICERAKDPVVRLHCLSRYAEAKRDIGPCRRFESEEEGADAVRDSCIAGVAIAGQDPEICGRIGRSEIRDACYLMLVVQFEADPENCARIENPKVREACGE